MESATGQSVLPIVGSSVPVRHSGNQYLFRPDKIREVVRKDWAVYSPITASALSPKMRIIKNAFDNVRNLFPEARAQTRLLGLILQRRLPKLLTSLRKKLVIHRLGFLSSCAKTSRPGTPTVCPVSYLLILSRISASHASSTSASTSGSTLERMRCAKVKRWSLGRSKASDSMLSSDFIVGAYCEFARLASGADQGTVKSGSRNWKPP